MNEDSVRRAGVVAAALLVTLLMAVSAAPPSVAQSGGFTFAIVVDQRSYAGAGQYDTPAYFRGALAALRARGGASFIISPGDVDPPDASRWSIDQTFGASMLWYPAVGNHEAETDADMVDLRNYNYDANGAAWPNIVRQGPAGCPTTTYSFDYENAHFAVLNEYCDTGGDTAADGDVSDHLYHWLAADLAGTTKKYKFVIGHEPAYPQADQDNGRLRHIGASLDKHPERRDRFWGLLKSHAVTAYLTGHTHNYSVARVNGVWQLDGGHARGLGDPDAPSTFVMVHVGPDSVTFDAYRETFDGVYDYDDLVHHGTLATRQQRHVRVRR